jgi:dipeptidyl aminopeptidase/acylaminoacyl peptidase
MQGAVGEVFQPNASLFAENIPPIPQALVTEVAGYTDIRGHSFIEWHPRTETMLVAHRPGLDTSQLFLLDSPGGELLQITNFDEPVTAGTFEPNTGEYIVYSRSEGGNEAAQLYRCDVGSQQHTLLTDPDMKHGLKAWFKTQSLLLTTAVPLDRTATTGTRNTVDTYLNVVDPLGVQAPRLLATLPGTGWMSAAVSWDDRFVAISRYVSANESSIWLVDSVSGESAQLLPRIGQQRRETWLAHAFSRDNRTLFVESDAFSEFKELVAVHLTSGLSLTAGAGPLETVRISSAFAWDMDMMTIGCRVEAGVVTDGDLAVVLNVDGHRELRVFDPRSFAENPQAMGSVPAGSITSAAFHPSPAKRLLAVGITSAQGPGQIHCLAIDPPRTVQWTRPFVPAGIDVASFTEQEIVRFPSFDGRTISAIVNYPTKTSASIPTASAPPRAPVLIVIHGGPESQAMCGFLGRLNYYVAVLGFCVIQPNVRGSSGYGKTFLDLDNGVLREDSVKDIGALLDWIDKQPTLDDKRVIVSGGSYGGYMSLAVSIHYASRIRASVDVVGISNFVTFLTNTESYRRELRRAEYGDERDPAMRAFLESISPLTHAEKLTKPLFVVQGRNDPRVPYTEAEQMVSRVRQSGNTVWYLLAANEGHGFQKKANTDFQFYSTIMFLKQFM